MRNGKVLNMVSEEGEMKTLSDMMSEVENGYNQYKEALDDLHQEGKITGTAFVCFDRNADQMFEDAKEKAVQVKKTKNQFELNVAMGYVEALIEWFNKPLVFPRE